MREISSLQHPLVKHFVRLRQNHDYRDEHQSVVVEGVKLIHELAQQHPIKSILACDGCLIPKTVNVDTTYIVNQAVMQKVTSLQNPEGLSAEIAMPKMASLKGKGFLIACDGINDPGNLGTLLRTALALGWEGAFILDNSCDPFNDKALRSAKGSTFRLPIARGSWKDLEALIKQNKLHPLAADIIGRNLDRANVKENVLLVLSNEAHGVSEEASKLCERITIPMSGQMESLNVASAGAILMYVLKKNGGT